METEEHRKREESPPARIVGLRTPEATSRLEQTKFRQSATFEGDADGHAPTFGGNGGNNQNGGSGDMYSALYDGVSGPVYKGVNGGLGGAPTGGVYAGVVGMTYGGGVGDNGGVGGNGNGF